MLDRALNWPKIQLRFPEGQLYSLGRQFTVCGGLSGAIFWGHFCLGINFFKQVVKERIKSYICVLKYYGCPIT